MAQRFGPAAGDQSEESDDDRGPARKSSGTGEPEIYRPPMMASAHFGMTT